MTEIVNPLLQWLNAHPNWAFFIIFLISAGESIAVVGTFVPGTIMMTAVGTLAGAGVVPLWIVIVSAILGAIVGDGVSYLMGKYFKDRIRLIWPFRKNPQWLEKGERFFHKHGGKSVFIGRFVGPVRAIIPVIAGMLGMNAVRFYIANILSAIGWAPAYMLPGILLGAISLELPPDLAVHAILMLFLVALFFSLCIWLLIKLFILVSNQIDQLLNFVWRKLENTKSGKIITIPLKHYNPQKKHGQLVLAFYFLLAVICFSFLAYDVTLHGAESIFINNSLFHFFRGLRAPRLDDIMVYITLLGDKRVLVPLIAILFGWLIISKRFYIAAHVFLLGVLTVGSIVFLKHFTHSPRPWGILNSPESFSFPSGHTTLSTTFYIGFALLLSQAYPSKKRFFISSSIVLALIVSMSRLYLGAHWFTDVLGGWLLSAALLILVTISYNRKNNHQIKLTGLFSTTIIIFILIYGISCLHYGTKLRQDYAAIDYPTISIPLNQWWNETDTQTPMYRINRFGIADQILSVQWIGNLDDIKNILLQNGWHTPPERNWINVILRIADVNSTDHLPLVSALHLDKKPVLVLTKNINDMKRLVVIRLWASNVTIEPNQQPLWVGTVDVIPRTYSWLFRKKMGALKIVPALLFVKTPPKYDIKSMAVPSDRLKHKFKDTPLLLLIKPNSLR